MLFIIISNAFDHVQIEVVNKMKFNNAPEKWKRAFAYIASRPEIEDVVISGGDAYMLAPNRLKLIGETLLSIPHIRRMRIATKGPAVMPMKILSDVNWSNALIDIVKLGREKGKEEPNEKKKEVEKQ